VSVAFAPGDAVRVRIADPSGHTRVPRYVRGRPGVVESVRGTWPLPDDRAHAVVPPAEPTVYTVRFASRDLFGPDGADDVTVSVDLWEPYLVPDAAAAAPRGDPNP
jgi:nitrile hydratase subunit beta